MAKREPVLKWRKVKDEWRAGPFSIEVFGAPSIEYNVFIACAPSSSVTGTFWDSFKSESSAKAACERLARKIIAATKKGRKHGK